MFNKNNMDIVDILLIGTILFFLIELLFISTGLLIFIGICGVFIYFGKKTYYRPRGKIMFWIGISLVVITILNTLAFKFLVLAAIIYFVYKWYKSKQEPSIFKPEFGDVEQRGPEGVSEQKGFLLSNKWFGKQQTRNRAYEWQDVNIQSGVGDIIIDLNYTVIPKSEPVIVIRNLVGNVQVIVPYDVEISVHHSVVFGSIQVLDHIEQNVFNRVLHVQTDNYLEAKHKVKIFTSMVAGKLEVKRG